MTQKQKKFRHKSFAPERCHLWEPETRFSLEFRRFPLGTQGGGLYERTSIGCLGLAKLMINYL
jgi:hypothetical protein